MIVRYASCILYPKIKLQKCHVSGESYDIFDNHGIVNESTILPRTPQKSMSRRVSMVKSEKVGIILLLLLLSELNQ